ncbi:MAG TPA: MBL fold metallo-hydrolase [Terriglobales bacterium]|nr:MBL fold metallo-hydrolase [Terriglobales bacterium]
MKRTLILVPLGMVLVAWAPSALAQRDLGAVVVRAERVADGLWMLSGAGGNIGLCAGGGEALMIDAEYGPLVPRIRAVADSLTGGAPVRFVLNTHYHGDHVNGDSAMAAAGASIVAHENVRARMSVTQRNAAFDMTIPPAPERALPVLTFTDSIGFHLGGREVRVFHLPPAHTDGDAVAWFPVLDALHTGDLFFNGMYPVIDASAGGSIDGMIRAVDLLLPLTGPATKIIPGHGPLGDRAALLRYRDMLVAVRDRVRPLVRGGKTLDEIIAAKPTADLDATWGRSRPPDRFLRMVVLGMTAGTGGAKPK